MRTYIESLFGIDQRYIMLMVDLKGMMIGTSCCCCFSASSSENELGGMTLENMTSYQKSETENARLENGVISDSEARNIVHKYAIPAINSTWK